MRIILALVAGDEQPQRDGGPTVRLETFLAAYYALRDANAELVLASPEGGYPPRLSRGDRKGSPSILQRFRLDRVAREEVADTLCIDQVVAADFDAAFCITAAGTPRHNATAVLVATLLASGKPVAILGDAAGLAPHELGSGVLIMAGTAGSPEAVARALTEATQVSTGP